MNIIENTNSPDLVLEPPIRDEEMILIKSLYITIKGKDYKVNFEETLSSLIIIRSLLPDCKEEVNEFKKATEDIQDNLANITDQSSGLFTNKLDEIEFDKNLDNNTKYNYLLSNFLLSMVNDSQQGQINILQRMGRIKKMSYKEFCQKNRKMLVDLITIVPGLKDNSFLRYSLFN